MDDHIETDTDQRHRSGPRRGSPDGGFTYVEVVIAIVLVSVIVLPILAAVRSSVRTAAVSRAAAEVETVLVNAADLVSRADRDDFKCDLTAPAQQAAAVRWDDASAVSVEHEHWDDTANGGAGGFVDGACPGTGYQNGLVQKIRIRVTSPKEAITRELEVVKSDV